MFFRKTKKELLDKIAKLDGNILAVECRLAQHEKRYAIDMARQSGADYIVIGTAEFADFLMAITAKENEKRYRTEISAAIAEGYEYHSRVHDIEIWTKKKEPA